MKTRVRMALQAFRTFTMAWCLVTFASALPQRRQSNVPFLGDLSVIDCRRPVLAYFPDPDDCRNFYHCSDWTGLQKKSCGNLYFNPQTGVCDWPSTVRRLRPECPSPDVVQAPITNVPKAFQALTTEERETLKIIQLNSNNSPVRFPEQETARRPVGPPPQPALQQGFPQNPPTHQVPIQSVTQPQQVPHQGFSQPQQAPHQVLAQPQQVPHQGQPQPQVLNSFERPIAAVLNSQSPPLRTSGLPPPPPPTPAAQVTQPQVVPHAQPINQHQVRQPVGLLPPETPRQNPIFAQPEPQQFQPSQPLAPAPAQVQPLAPAPQTTIRLVGPQPTSNQQFENPAVGQVVIQQVNPLQQRQPIVEPQPPAPPRGVVILPPAPPPQRFENPEPEQPPPPPEDLVLVEVTTPNFVPEVLIDASEPTQSPVVIVTTTPEEKTRSQLPNLKRRPIHTRVKVENQVPEETEQVEEEKQHHRARVPISTSRPDSSLKAVRNRFTPPSPRPDFFKQRRPLDRHPEKEKVKEEEEEESPKTLPKTDFKSNRARLQGLKPGTTRGSTETPSEDAFLLCSDDTCFEPNTLEEGGVPDLKPAASARLPDDNLRQIFEQMTVRLNSDSKDDQTDTIRQFLEAAKEKPKEDEEESQLVEENEQEEEELEVTTQKDESQESQESNRSNESKLFRTASDRPKFVLPKKNLLPKEDLPTDKLESSTTVTGLTEDVTTSIVDIQSTTKEYTIEESFTTEETRANREIVSSGFSLNTEQPVDEDLKQVDESPSFTTEVVNEEEQELTTQFSEPEVKNAEELANTPEDAVGSTQEPLVVEEDLIIVEPVAFVEPELADPTESTNVFPEKFLEGVPVISPSELEALMNEAVTQDVQEESTQTELTTPKAEELLTEAFSGASAEASETIEPEVTETVETTPEPGTTEPANTDAPSADLKEFVSEILTQEEEETTTTIQPDIRPPSLSTLETLLSKLNSGDPVDTFLSIMSNFDLSALVSIANNEENKLESDRVEQPKVIDENGVQVVMPVGWFETPDEEPQAFEDETTQAPTTEKPAEKVEEAVILATEAPVDQAPTTTLSQTTTTFEKVVTITPGQVLSTTQAQEEASTVPPQASVVEEAKVETTVQPDPTEAVTDQGILVVNGVSVTFEATTEGTASETTLRPIDDKGRKLLARPYKPKARIPVVPASSTSKTVSESHTPDEEERSKFANSRNRIRQRLRTLSGTTSASKALEILNDRAKSENGQKSESLLEDEKLDVDQVESSDGVTLPLVAKDRTKINVTKLVDRRNELFKKRVPITTSPHPKEDPNVSASTSQKPLFANPSRRPFRLSASNAEQQPVSELTASESSTSTTTVELSSKQKNIRCRLFRRACNEEA